MTLQELRQVQQQAGAVFHPDGYPLTFGREQEADAARLVVLDRSHWGRLRLLGADRIRYWHNQSTNNIQALAVGQGCDTVLVTPTGRTLDLVTTYVEPEWLTLIISPAARTTIPQWLEKYIFFADQVTVADHTDTTVLFTLLGQEATPVIAALGAAALVGQPTGTHTTVLWQGNPVLVAVGTGLAHPGYTLMAPVSIAATLWNWLTHQGAIPWGDQAWEWLRIAQGRPAVGAELTPDYNPLEAGLWHAVSFQKGCYIGQETLARLNTYQGVKQQLWGLVMTAPASPGTPLRVNGEKVGQLTSYTHYFGREHRGLGYLRTKAGGAGLTVDIAGQPAQVVDIPLAHRGYLSQRQG